MQRSALAANPDASQGWCPFRPAHIDPFAANAIVAFARHGGFARRRRTDTARQRNAGLQRVPRWSKFDRNKSSLGHTDCRAQCARGAGHTETCSRPIQYRASSSSSTIASFGWPMAVDGHTRQKGHLTVKHWRVLTSVHRHLKLASRGFRKLA